MTARGTIGPVTQPFATRAGRRRLRVAYTFMLPSLVILNLFMFYPLVRAAYLSLTDSSFFGSSQFIGLGNYSHLLHDAQFWHDLRTTAYYAAVVTPASVVLAFGLALLLNRRHLPARGAHLLAGEPRHKQQRLARQHHPGPACGNDRRHLENCGFLHGHLPRRPTDRPPRVLRGGPRRRRFNLAAVPLPSSPKAK